MKILEVKTLAIPDIKVIRFGRYNDSRGYFTEVFRESDFQKLDFMKGVKFLQCNDAYSKTGTFRGLHFQWNPYMGKLVRVVRGRILDFALDIRKCSPTFGKVIAYELISNPEDDQNEWIWLPPGFAHGFLTLEDRSVVEYHMSQIHHPDSARGVRWDDPALGIEWPSAPEVFSAHDAQLPTLGVALEEGGP